MMAASTDIRDTIVNAIHGSADGLDSLQIAAGHLKMVQADRRIAHIAVSAILRGERRCRHDRDGRWRAVAADAVGAQALLTDQQWRVAYILTDSNDTGTTALHVSVWQPGPVPQLVCSHWLVDPQSLPVDDQERLRSACDAPFQHNPEETARLICQAVGGGPLVVASGRHYRLFSRLLTVAGESACDDWLLLAHLARAAGLGHGRSITVQECWEQLFNESPVLTAACRGGEMLAQCCAALLERLQSKGLQTREAIESVEIDTAPLVDWASKKFNLQTLRKLSDRAGVYGFKDAAGQFIYIGKAANLRRRLLGYFRQTEESPAKLEQLRAQSCELEIHACGSELESLIYEYRLIRRHKPLLNRQTVVNERPGVWTPLPDEILLVAHAQPGMALALFVRSGQKIRLRPIPLDWTDDAALMQEIEVFFFAGVLPPQSTDFAEHEIVVRYVKRHRDRIPAVQVHRYADAAGVLAALKTVWRDARACDSGSGQE